MKLNVRNMRILDFVLSHFWMGIQTPIFMMELKHWLKITGVVYNLTSVLIIHLTGGTPKSRHSGSFVLPRKRHHDQALFLLNFFAADMFNFYFKKLYSFSRAFDFLIDQLFIRIVFHRNLFQDFRCFCTFFQ